MRYTATMAEDEKKPTGRPEGRTYPHVRSMRFTDKDVERLRALSQRLELPEVQVIRTAIRALAKEHGID